jgi:predicted nucleotidyltransferase
MLTKEEFYRQLNNEREEILKKVIDIFSDGAVEAHIFGSIARGNPDAFSDIDIWFTYKDEDFEKVKSERIDNYKKIGNLLQAVEPPQNAPETFEKS